nr:BppU family phage baseplate upper protein [Bacillus cereus]
MERNDTMVNSIFKTYEVTVDTMRDSSVSQAMRYSQNDLKSAKILITVNHNGNEEDFSEATAVRVSFEKGDKKIVYQDCQPINALKGKYQVLLTTQTLTSVGIVTANVHIYFPNDKKIETGSFTFEVVESKMSDEVIQSTDAFPVIHKAIEAGEKLEGVDITALIASKETAEAALQEVNKNKERLGILQQGLSKQGIKSQALQHGPNVVNATVASPLNVEVQGRTLVNLLGQTTLDPTKYYLFMPNKGTTKITAGGSSYDGVAKFTGQSAIAYTIKQDFWDKVSKSTLENGHMQKANVGSTSLLAPSAFTSEETQWGYDRIKNLNVEPNSESAGANLCIAQILISFDVVRTLQDKFGIQIWQGKTALADKITIAKQLVVDYAAVLYANGSSPQGNKLYVKRWIPSTSTWFGSTTTTESNLTKVQTGSTNVQEIDSNGFIHVIAYADASDGIRPSVVNVDYAMLELKVKADVPMLEDALYEVDQATYNKINIDPEFTGQKLMDKFPYVEGIKHLNPVVIVEGTNLIPPFIEGTLHPNTKVIGPYELELNPTTPFQASSMKIPCLPNQKYTFSSDATQTGTYFVKEMDANGSQIRQIFSGKNEQFLTGPNAKFIKIEMSNRTVEKFTFIKPMLVLGDAPQQFVPRNPSYLYTNTVLAGKDGINDVLYEEDGKWKVLRKWTTDKVTDAITLLPKPVIEVVQAEGRLAVDGMTQVTVDSGISVREKVNFKLDVYDKKYKANNLQLSGTVLKNKVDTIIKVYKNGMEEKRITITRDSLAFGEERISINEEDFDPSAEYTVTYLVLDKHQFTTNITDVKVSYNQSVRSTVDELTVKQADTVTGLNILQNLMTDVLARLKANGL